MTVSTFALHDNGTLADELDARERRPRRLTNLRVDEVSLVDRPANQHARILIAKGADDARRQLAAEVAEVERMEKPGAAMERVEKSLARLRAVLGGSSAAKAGAAGPAHDAEALAKVAKREVGGAVLGLPPSSGRLVADAKAMAAEREEAVAVSKLSPHARRFVAEVRGEAPPRRAASSRLRADARRMAAGMKAANGGSGR